MTYSNPTTSAPPRQRNFSRAAAAPPRPRHQRNAGFTLMEILIVVFIIVGLVAITLAAGTYMRSAAQSRQTAVLLQTLHNASTEYQAQMGYAWGDRPNHWNDPTNVYDPDNTIGWFLRGTQRVPEVYQIIAALREQLEYGNVNGDTGPIAANDNWGTAIVYRHPDANMTDEPIRYLPPRHRPYFASAGPDEQWGDYEEWQNRERGEPHDADLAEQAADNIYSFELD
ncbi:type II secretion system protein [Phycisphaerales bacterium AB-hyl4]|uniref:Type II secretion system protein n=1 Tax=Natronomicrosphaera hydrolytica TaxID=3242702 RepID=A0ABV4U7E8_9BACT